MLATLMTCCSSNCFLGRVILFPVRVEAGQVVSRKRSRSGLFAVGRHEPSSACFRAGEEIMVTGLYRVFHIDHRVRHEAILCAGGVFPRCSKCAEEVQFDLLAAAPQLQKDRNFSSLKLYEIPHPSEEQRQESKKKAS